MDSLFKLRIKRFYANKRARVFFFIFIFLCVISLFAPFLANEKPLLIYKDHKFYFPVFINYPETAFGGEFYTSPDYNDPYVKNLLKGAFILKAPIPYSPSSIDWHLKNTPPTSPSLKHLLGTDDQGRDVLTRVLYGTSISLAFGLILSLLSSIIGIGVGALQGYYGGLVDLLGQRFIEIWSSVPTLFLLIILASLVTLNFWFILLITLAFSWMSLVGVVRAEFLRARAHDYVKASIALGLSNIRIIFIHILPNALVATITYLPFIIAGSITTLVSLDFLGFGMPIGTPSLGELLNQAKNNLQSPHLAIVAFVIVSLILSSLVFIGEGIRDAFGQKANQGPL
ncbi:ABC transporter permease [Helicobacter sp. 13S00401-1]|uniref:ABC transporter permease n=1 Tax=Helicobacter sp. 13S00401-1 TaxID=1905758 RepID=UPI000BA5DB02|nr:ABC transporter permease [Helicobacter sp. 13S00401-1]PAF51222.1 ABC transporter permease [Helicobacter sp. 13S00401-1]